MRITEFAYGKSKLTGAYDCLLNEEIYKEINLYHPKIFDFQSDENAVSIRYMPLAYGEYLLTFATSINDGTAYDDRGQMIVHGYMFDQEAADELWRHPEWIMDIRYYSKPEQIEENLKFKEINSWKKLLRESMKSELSRKENMEVECIYVECMFTEKIDHSQMQIIHILENDGRKNMKILLEILLNFPPQLRREISWNSNVKTMDEGNYQIICMDEKSFDEIEKGGYEGGKAIQRIILEEEKIQQDEPSDQMKEFVECYMQEKEEIFETAEKYDGDKEKMAGYIIGKMKRQESARRKRASTKYRKRQKQKENKQKHREKAGLIGRAGIFAVCLAILVCTVRFTKEAELYYTISFSDDVLTIAAAIWVGWYTRIFAEYIKKERKR